MWRINERIETSITPFRIPRAGWVWAVSAFVLIGMILGAVFPITNTVTELSALGIDPERPDLEPALQFLAFAFVNYALVLVAFAVALVGLPVWGIWHWMAARNLQAMGEKLEFHPIWHAFCWTIPIVNLPMSYLVMRELFVASAADKNSLVARPASLPLWWGMYVGQYVILLFSITCVSNTLFSALFDWLSLPLMIGSNALYLFYIHQISREQAERVSTSSTPAS